MPGLASPEEGDSGCLLADRVYISLMDHVLRESVKQSPESAMPCGQTIYDGVEFSSEEDFVTKRNMFFDLFYVIVRDF